VTPRGVPLAVGVALVGVLAAGCGGTEGTPQQDAAAPAGEVVVFAASSLTDAVGDLADAFTAHHPDVRVTASLAGSQQLAGQIVDGAPADLFLSADDTRMQQVVDAGHVEGEPVVVATNRLAIAVEPGNPHDVRGLDDLARADLLVALASPEVPAGAYAVQALTTAGVEASPVTLEPDVRSVAAKVELGEVDVGLVYASDIVAAAGRLESVEVPEELDPRPRIPAAVLADAPNAPAARAFLAFLTSEEGQAILAANGFGPP
jgi:molybdate transport system substrate-binding protein